LLERLRVPFHVHSPNLDESPHPGETPRDLAIRLARAKAQAVRELFPESIVIGADQVAVCGEQKLGKPGNAARTAEQLRLASGQKVNFLTAVSVAGPRLAEHVDVTTVQFRTLSEPEIARYIDREQPFDCAGGFKAEGLGIALFERLVSQDPTAIVGLPLIWLSQALRDAGIEVP
jgi:septum formation protein